MLSKRVVIDRCGNFALFLFLCQDNFRAARCLSLAGGDFGKTTLPRFAEDSVNYYNPIYD